MMNDEDQERLLGVCGSAVDDWSRTGPTGCTAVVPIVVGRRTSVSIVVPISSIVFGRGRGCGLDRPTGSILPTSLDDLSGNR